MQKLDGLTNEQGMARDYFFKKLYNYVGRVGVEQFDGSNVRVWSVKMWLSVVYNLSQICFMGSLGDDDCWMLHASKRPEFCVKLLNG
jgi:hypothetical protein